jgi:hypothetical protein
MMKERLPEVRVARLAKLFIGECLSLRTWRTGIENPIRINLAPAVEDGAGCKVGFVKSHSLRLGKPQINVNRLLSGRGSVHDPVVHGENA